MKHIYTKKYFKNKKELWTATVRKISSILDIVDFLSEEFRYGNILNGGPLKRYGHKTNVCQQMLQNNTLPEKKGSK